MTLDMEKLTAYVLGELEDNEREAVEALLVGDEAAREAVAELRATAALAREALHSDQPAALAPEQHAAIEAKLESARPKRRGPTRLELLTVAAIMVIMIGVTFLVTPQVLRRSKMASLDTRVDVASPTDTAAAPERAMMHRKSVPAEHQMTREEADRALRESQMALLKRQESLKALPEGADASGIRAYNGEPVELYQSRINNAASLPQSKAEPAKPDAQATVNGGRLPELARLNEVNQVLTDKGDSKKNESEVTDYYFSKDSDGDGLANPQSSTSGGKLHFRTWYFADPAGVRSIPPGANAPALSDPAKVYWPDHNTEAYAKINDNPFKEVAQEPLSTFSIDVDTASYANLRRFLTQGSVPPPDSVRIEELLNYFDYDYAPPPDKSTPFASHVEVAACPWAPEHRLARVALKGWEMAANERPASNLVFLIDVSGSMEPENKLPLLKEALRMLVRQLDERDRIAMVVYAGNSGLVLPSTQGNEQEKILDAIGQLESGGSTHGSAGIQLAYETAVQNFLPGATNRVLLCTDGDFNVGVTDQGQLVRMVEEKAKSGVFLTVLGFGMGNLKDATLEQLADKGNGNYAYIDTLNEARKVLVQGLSGTLVTIAKDVKIQIEFNPAKVKAYRLIGYENRILAKEDFNDDTKDAGEIGAGHTVTALYELVPPGAATPGAPNVDPLKYQQPAQPKADAQSDDLFTLKLRYKAPDGDTSKLLEYPARDSGETLDAATPDFRFAAAVAELGMILRGSPNQGNSTYDATLHLAEGALGKDPYGYRSEFLQLVQKAKSLSNSASGK
jgi:Ca-activated chloride channel family protein